jgi:phage I-like protein
MLGFAVCATIAVDENGAAPEWIPILPAGPVLRGRDGRAWTLKEPVAVLNALVSAGVDLVVDFNHASEIQAPRGEPSPAAGFIVEAVAKAGGEIWGRVDWTQEGLKALQSRQYRYISPAFRYDKLRADATQDTLGEILELTSVGLVNTPNFDQLPALNHAEGQNVNKELLEKLGLPADASEDQVSQRIAQLAEAGKAKNASVPEDLDARIAAAVNSAVQGAVASVVSEIKSQGEAQTHEVAVNSALEKYTREGKLTPAELDFWRGFASESPDKLKSFCSHMDSRAAVVNNSQASLQGAPEGTVGQALTAYERKLCSTLGIDESEFKKVSLYKDGEN